VAALPRRCFGSGFKVADFPLENADSFRWEIFAGESWREAQLELSENIPMETDIFSHTALFTSAMIENILSF
jgi:hypothetical protein